MAETAFTPQEHELFAIFSGDFNPLHTNEQYSRRSRFGNPVIHGIHLLLRAFEYVESEGLSKIKNLSAEFRGAVSVGRSIQVVASKTSLATFEISFLDHKLIIAKFSIELEACKPPSALNAPTWEVSAAAKLDIDSLEGREGVENLALDPELLEQLFPSLSQKIALQDIAFLLAVTRVIGMQVPGENALFRSFVWTNQGMSPTNNVNYRITKVDHRFSIATVAFTDHERVVDAQVAIRHEPPQQPSLSVMKGRVTPREFLGSRVLIVGGSRGLGEVAAKVIVAGGGNVMITYRSGRDDAQALERELSPFAELLQLDVTTLGEQERTKISAFGADSVIYSATPPITPQAGPSWNQNVFQQFVGMYVSGLLAVLEAAREGGFLTSVTMPSSEFIDATPTGFSEYALAKELGEISVARWAQKFSGLEVFCPRLPPLVTDQTVEKLGSDTSVNVDPIYELIRGSIRIRREGEKVT